MSPQDHQLTKEQEQEARVRAQHPTKPEVPKARVFKVRRYSPFDMDVINRVVPEGFEEGIEAHRMEEHVNGNITFYRYLEAHIGDQGIWYTYRVEKLLAAGTYYDIREVSHEFDTRPTN